MRLSLWLGKRSIGMHTYILLPTTIPYITRVIWSQSRLFYFVCSQKLCLSAFSFPWKLFNKKENCSVAIVFHYSHFENRTKELPSLSFPSYFIYSICVEFFNVCRVKIIYINIFGTACIFLILKYLFKNIHTYGAM